MQQLKFLTEDIGPRWAGRISNKRAADYLAHEFASLHLDVQLQSFPFVGWDVETPPTLDVLAVDGEPEDGEPDAAYQAEVALMEYSGSTPLEGIEGTLERAGTAYVVPGFLEWPRYLIRNDQGAAAAYLVAHQGLAGWLGPAIPLHTPDPMVAWPMAVLAEKEHNRFATWLDAGKTVRVRFNTQGSVIAPMHAHNVIATLPGESDEIVAFCAHLDTAYGTAGAHNNASGIQALHEIATRLAREPKHQLTYQFLLFDACEWHYLGSRYFVNELRAHGQLSRYRAAINVDTVGAGDSLYFLAYPDDLRRRAETVVDELSLRQRFRQVEFLGALAGSDHHSFLQAGIPASEILFWPCDVYKLPSDTSETIDPASIALAAEIAYTLAKSYEHDVANEVTNNEVTNEVAGEKAAS